MIHLSSLFDFILHLDTHLTAIINQYGVFTYLLLFTIIFMETGLVVTPFLPGDSLLFAAGALAAGSSLQIEFLLSILTLAAILGDTVNYWLGFAAGPRVFKRDSRFLNQENLEKTEKFYEKHGGKTIILARFIPIIRTFAPFVAGIGKMSYPRFLSYNIFGGAVWVVSLVLGGYFFGNLPLIKKNFELVILAVILISLLPLIFGYLKQRLA